ncbi:MAG: hypothetical protein HUU54_03770 [Ignavibacteriaceae bacterium]|nr:hypothetical protein [Ignavibacteriaceae bacterium]
MKPKFYKPFFFFLFVLIFTNCYAPGAEKGTAYRYKSSTRLAPIPKPDKHTAAEFNAKSKAPRTTLQKNDTLNFSGFVTKNKHFLEKIIVPALTPYIDSLKAMQPADAISEITLYTHELYRTYFGRSFYRWGGDIFDLDDPQDKGVRHKYSFGLDCSGFTAMPYELAVYFGILNPEKEEALFSSAGFANYCRANNHKDSGGRNGTSNNYRLDTSDLIHLGREIITIPKGGKPDSAQMAKLQPGDIVGRNGHFGILVKIKGTLYYLESGGWVMPVSKGYPYRADKALKIFAKNGPLMVRRCLPDLEKGS